MKLLPDLVRPLSVRAKLLVIAVLSSATALTLAGIALVAYDQFAARNSLREELAVLARVIGGRSTAALVFADQGTALENLTAAVERRAIVAACIWAERGELFAAYTRSSAATTPCASTPPLDGSRFGEQLLDVVQPIYLDDHRIGTIHLRAELSELNLRLRRFVLAVALVVVLATTTAVFFSSRLQRIVAQPISHLRDATRAIAAGQDFSVRAVKETDDELGELVEAFNTMLGTLDAQNRELVSAKNQAESLVAELEMKNAELERFTYTVSHDLKSPLITIKGFLNLLERDLERGDAERAQRDVSRLRAAADKMRLLLDELLELSRIGRLMEPPCAVVLAEVIGEVTELLAGKIVERDVEIAVADDLPVVSGDRRRLVEVLQNLIDNAIKFSGAQPHPRIEIAARADGDQALVTVRDNGPGIDPRYREKVFELFERLDPHSEGSGIGLAIVRRIVEVHGGRIWLEDAGELGGASFCFTLPLASPGRTLVAADEHAQVGQIRGDS